MNQSWVKPKSTKSAADFYRTACPPSISWTSKNTMSCPTQATIMCLFTHARIMYQQEFMTPPLNTRGHKQCTPVETLYIVIYVF